MNYNTEIFKNYFDANAHPDYLKVHRGNQEFYADNLADLLPRDKDSKILEIGCGAGQLLYYLKVSGYKNIEGADIGEEQVKFLESMGINGTVISSLQEYLKDKKDHYDLIIMNQVIEHFPKSELWDNSSLIYKSLRKGGAFIFITPNMSCLSGLSQRYTDFTHEIGFTERSASQIMRIAGFKDIVVRGDKITLKLRIGRIVWWLSNIIWHSILGFIYYVEKGMDRPRILSRHLIVIGKR